MLTFIFRLGLISRNIEEDVCNLTVFEINRSIPLNIFSVVAWVLKAAFEYSYHIISQQNKVDEEREQMILHTNNRGRLLIMCI